MKLIEGLKFYSIFLLIISTLCCCQDKGENEPRSKIDFDGPLLIDGAKKFIIGSYHYPKVDNPFKNLRDNGYNLVKASAHQHQLDSAYKYGLMTWITTGSISNNKRGDSLHISELVSKFKDHPSLLFWEIEDEPAFTWNSGKARISPENMHDTYTLIKSVDRKHFVYTNHAPVNLVSTLRRYNKSTDIVACDVYPVIPDGIIPTYALFPDGLQGDLLNPYISQVGEYVEKMKRVTQGKKPIFMVLQGFAWELLKPNGSRDLAMVKYPTYRETRFMAYNAIIHGAMGIIYWGTDYTPKSSEFINDLNLVTRELSEYQSIFIMDNINENINIKYHELGFSVDAGIEWILKEYNNKLYFITCNADKTPAKVTFSGFSDYKIAKVLKENRNQRIMEGNFTDFYNDFEVHVYEIMK